jgi:hypothetical protein
MKRLTIADIIQRYNDEAESAREYNQSEDSSTAEFVGSFGYNENTIKSIVDGSYGLEDTTKQRILTYNSKHGHKTTLSLLAKFSELKLTGIYRETGEIFSATCGEVEHQPDEDLLAAFLKLSPKSREKVRKACDEYISDSTCKGWLYLNMSYDHWVMVLDEDRLNEHLDNDSSMKARLISIEGAGTIKRRSQAKLKLVAS